MRNIIILIFSLTVVAVKSQTIIGPEDCGLTYIYDNAGNRICRLVVLCGTPHGKKENSETTYIASMPEQETDSSAKEISEDVLLNAEISWLFPNPTQGEFKVVFSKYQEKARLSIIDNNGSQLFSDKVNGYDATFDISNYAAGTYWVRIVKGNKRESKKIMKQ